MTYVSFKLKVEILKLICYNIEVNLYMDITLSVVEPCFICFWEWKGWNTEQLLTQPMTLDNVGFVRCVGGVWGVLEAALKLLGVFGFQLSCCKKDQDYIICPRMRFFFFPFSLVVYLALFDYLPECIYKPHPRYFFQFNGRRKSVHVRFVCYLSNLTQSKSLWLIYSLNVRQVNKNQFEET